METLDKASRNCSKLNPVFLDYQGWIFLLLLLLSVPWVGSAQADLTITSITQSPVNNVPFGQAITYEVTTTFTGEGSEGEYASISILLNDANETYAFTSDSCSLDGIYYCGTVSSVSVFRFTWYPTSVDTHELRFTLDCSPNCIGDAKFISTIVSNSDLSDQPSTADAGLDQSVTDSNDDGTETVTLDASGSSLVTGYTYTYEWFEGSKLLGTGETLTTELAVGIHSVNLRVATGGLTLYDQVNITVNPFTETIQSANAGSDQSVTDSNGDGIETVILDASGSNLMTSNTYTYDWFDGDTFLGTGETHAAELAVGIHPVTLRVASGDLVFFDSVNITVLEAPNTNDGSPSIETLSGQNQRLSEGDYSNPLSIRAIGSDGLPLSGVTITWTVIPFDAASLTSDTTTTDSNGESSNIVRLAAERIPGTFQVSASIPSGTSARFLINPLAGISGLTPAQRSIAGALDNACPAIQSLNNEVWTMQEQSLIDSCDYLATASDQEIISALDQYLPYEIAAQGKNSISFARIRNRNILLRLDALRRGFTGPSVENLSLSIQGEQLPSFLISELSGLQRGGGASADDSTLASPLGVFINGNISLGDTETTQREAGFDFSTSGLTLGVDYRFTNEFVFGGAFNYLSSDSDYISKTSNLDIEGYSLSLYGSYYKSEQIFVDSIVSIGLNSYDSKREFTTGGMQHNLDGDTDGTEYELSLGAGYEYNNQNLTFVPEVRINYLHIEVDGYDETSANSGLNLSIDKQDIESLVATVSGSVSLAYSTEYGVFIPYLSIEWEHEFNNDSRAIVARFVNDPSQTNFSVLTDNPDRDYFNLGLGVTAALQKGKSAFLYYEKLLGHSDTSQYTITGGFRIEF